jgi:polyphenol oxidase
MPSLAVSAWTMSQTMSAPGNTLFMGSQTGSMGAMERQPHGPIHIWTGDVTMRGPRSDMGVLTTASKDPIFFAHHANIDRLWGVWLGLSAQHKNFTSPTWLTHPWQFYDENSIWTEIQIDQVREETKSLRYEYQPPSAKPIWKFTPRPALSALAAEEGLSLIIANDAQGVKMDILPTTRSVTLPHWFEMKISGLSEGSASEYALHIEGIEVPSDEQALFNVFLNMPEATASTSLDIPNFVGTVTVLAKGPQLNGHAGTNTNAAFDVTDALAVVAKGKNTLSVTLVPVAADGETPVSFHASFKLIYIEPI